MKFSKKKINGFTDENTRPLLPPPGIHFKRPRVCRHHAHMLKTHVRVVPAYTGFSACHTPHTPHTTPQPTTTTRPPHHTETDTERETLRGRGDEREEDKRTEERREKREERRSIFSVVVHGRFLLVL